MIRLATILLLTACSLPAFALSIGDQAPSLAPATWVKGSAPDFSQQVTVVEFWATWCGPCLQSIPHLTELQAEYGDQVRIAGLSDEEVGTIEPFVTEQGAGMAYDVGRLVGDAREAWMAGVGGIPHAFIVGTDGTVLWKGHPMTMDKPLAQIVTGDFDPEEAQRVGAAQTALQESFRTRDMATIKAAALDLLAIDPTHEQGLYVFAGVTRQEGDLAGYRAHFAGLEAEALGPAGAAMIATLLLTSEDPDFRLLDVAVPMAEQAVAAAPEDAAAQGAAATARYLLGDLDGAIAHAERAVELDGDDETLAARLAYYRLAAELAAR